MARGVVSSDLLDLLPLGQCRLTLSGGNLLLSPDHGNLVTIAGQAYAIPEAGVALSSAGAAADTTYYIYVYPDANGMLALERSTTTRTADADTGVQIKTGDRTRTLVAQARTSGAGAWVDTPAQRYVRSWFNGLGALGKGVFTANRTTGSATYVEIDTEIRVGFLCWDGEKVTAWLSGRSSHDTINTAHRSVIGFDGAVEDGGTTAHSSVVNVSQPAPPKVVVTLSEGYHYATLFGNTPAGTASWQGGTAPDRCALYVLCR